MCFKFQKSDKLDELHPNLKKHFSLFVSRRIAEVDSFNKAVDESNFDYLRDYCHKLIGISASYNCFKLDEITRYIQINARLEEIGPIKSIKSLFIDYLNELSVISKNL